MTTPKPKRCRFAGAAGASYHHECNNEGTHYLKTSLYDRTGKPVSDFESPSTWLCTPHAHDMMDEPFHVFELPLENNLICAVHGHGGSTCIRSETGAVNVEDQCSRCKRYWCRAHRRNLFVDETDGKKKCARCMRKVIVPPTESDLRCSNVKRDGDRCKGRVSTMRKKCPSCERVYCNECANYYFSDKTDTEYKPCCDRCTSICSGYP